MKVDKEHMPGTPVLISLVVSRFLHVTIFINTAGCFAGLVSHQELTGGRNPIPRFLNAQRLGHRMHPVFGHLC